MDVVEAIKKRKSIRAFKSDPVPRGILKDIIDVALRAPSWGNSQPWELAIVSGGKLEEIREALALKFDERPNPDLTFLGGQVEPYISRSRTLGMKIFEIKGIDRKDSEKRKWWQLQGLKFFEAPCVIYIYVDRSFCYQDDRLNVWPIFDCGLVIENVMLLATSYGLGTIPQVQSLSYPDVLRNVLGIPDSKVMVLGIAIGYPDWDDAINQLITERESSNELARWYGFD